MELKQLPLFFLAVLFFSCKKQEQPVTRTVEFNTTNYVALGTYDTLGKPGNLLTRETISPTLLTYIKSTLTDKVDLRTTNPGLISTTAIADVAITQPSDVAITFVAQGAGSTSTFAFYTYPTNHPPASTADIKTITYAFPNSGRNTPLKAGDRVKIGRFEAGISIGFVILQNGWDLATHTINNKVVHFCSNDVLNPEVDPSLKKHAVVVNYHPGEGKFLIGFEDVNRTFPTCDHDFNDVVVYCTVTP